MENEDAYFPAHARELQRRDAIFFHLEEPERFELFFPIF